MPPKKTTPTPRQALQPVTEGQVVAAGLRRQAADLIRWAQKLEDEAMAGQPKRLDQRKMPTCSAYMETLKERRVKA